MKTPFHLILLKTFHAQRNCVRPSMAEIGLSPGQPKILNFLAAHNRCMQKELAAECEIEPATVSRLLNGMEEAGLIRREQTPGDKRAGCIVLTPKGEAIQKQASERFDQIMEKELQGFTEEERNQFSSYLSRMYKNLTGRTI